MIRPEHLFVGILLEESGPAYVLLHQFNVSIERLRANTTLKLRKTDLDSVEASRVEKVRQLLGLRESDMEELFTTAAIDALILAQSEALMLLHSSFEPDHILLGLAGDKDSTAARALKMSGIELHQLRSGSQHLDAKSSSKLQSLQVPRQTKNVLERAFDIAEQRKSAAIDSDLLLLGILEKGSCINLFHWGRLDYKRFKATVLELLGEAGQSEEDLLAKHLDCFEQTSAAVDEDKPQVAAQPERLTEIASFSPDVLNRFANFSADSLKVVMVAQEAARTLGYSLVGSEQILVGLMFVDEGKTAAALKLLGLTPEILISQVNRFIGKEPTTGVVSVPYTLKAQQLFERAREAAALANGSVTTEHLLLSLLSDKQSLACIILQWGGADLAKLEKAVAEPVFDYQAAISKSPYQFRELDLEHAEDDWSVLEERFTANLRTVIDGAKADSCRRNKGIVDAPHLFFALVNLPTKSCAHYLEAINLDRFAVRDALDKLITGRDQDKISTFVEFDTLAKQALLRAFQLSRFEGGGCVQTKHLLLAMLEPQRHRQRR